MKMGVTLYTYVSDINIRKEKMYIGSVGVVISSERIIVIALTGKHIFFDLSYIIDSFFVYYVKVRIIIPHLSSSKESLKRYKCPCC